MELYILISSIESRAYFWAMSKSFCRDDVEIFVILWLFWLVPSFYTYIKTIKQFLRVQGDQVQWNIKINNLSQKSFINCSFGIFLIEHISMIDDFSRLEIFCCFEPLWNFQSIFCCNYFSQQLTLFFPVMFTLNYIGSTFLNKSTPHGLISYWIVHHDLGHQWCNYYSSLIILYE